MGADLIGKSNAVNGGQAPAQSPTPPVPGKRTLTGGALPRTTHDLTDEYISEPILPTTERQTVLDAINYGINNACTNTKLAITEVRLTRLLKKSDDVPFMLSLILDVVGAHFLIAITEAFKEVKEAGKALSKEAASNLTLVQRAQVAVSKADERQVYTYVRTALSNVQRFATRKLTGVSGGGSSNAVAYLDQLRNSIDIAYQNLHHAVPAASDAELRVMQEAFDVTHHSIDQYRGQIEEKLKRWEASGVQKIQLEGNYFMPITENDVTSDQGPVSGAADEGQWHDPGTFVEWRQYLSGRIELTLKHDGHADKPGSVRSGGQRTNVVPDEFHAEAVARHQEVWGSAPGTDPVIYDDSNYWWDPERAKAAQANKPKPPLPEPINVPDELKMPTNVSRKP